MPGLGTWLHCRLIETDLLGKNSSFENHTVISTLFVKQCSVARADSGQRYEARFGDLVLPKRSKAEQGLRTLCFSDRSRNEHAILGEQLLLCGQAGPVLVPDWVEAQGWDLSLKGG